MTLLPIDVSSGKNLSQWNDDKILRLVEGVLLRPLEAKALHVMGLLLQNFEAAGHLLSFNGRLAANYYLQAYLLACTCIELLGYCTNGRENLIKGDGLEQGLRIVGLDQVVTNYNTYTVQDLIALRNLAAHGQGVASHTGISHSVALYVELLDTFPSKMLSAFDTYYDQLFISSKKRWRRNLANAGVEPIHYEKIEWGSAFYPPLIYAHRKLIQPQKRPSDAAINTDWQVYK